MEGPSHESVKVIVDSYLQRNDYNVLVLDWSQLANGNYLIDAVPNAKQVLPCALFCFVYENKMLCIICLVGKNAISFVVSSLRE